MKSQPRGEFFVNLFASMASLTDIGMTKLLVVVTAFVLSLGAESANADAAFSIDSFQKISSLEGGFGAGLDPADLFGSAAAEIGDLDGDGVTDLAVGVFGDDDGGFNTGALWILFLNTDGTVKAKQKISETQGGFGGSLNTNAVFGASLDGLGDLDGDGVPDLVVGNFGDDDGGIDRGAIWILFLNTDGTVKAEQKISSLQGFFGAGLSNNDQFGHDVANIGDLDGDGVIDIAVGAWFDDDGGPNRGAVWILFMHTNGTVKAKQKISYTQGGFGGTLDDTDEFGTSVASIGDVDGDGVSDIAVGAVQDDDGGTDRGSVWILFMNPVGTVKAEQKISSTQGGLTGPLNDGDLFSWSVGDLGDLDKDGMPDIVVGSRSDDDGALNAGAVWLLFLNADGTVKAEQKISATQGGFSGVLDANDLFGTSVTRLTDLDGDGVTDLAVGAIADDDGGNAKGAVWILFVERDLDGDGIPDDADACPTSDLSPTVVIGDCDTGAINQFFPNGCTISDDVMSCSDSARNHGHFVSCVARVANSLKKDGIISKREQAAIKSCAAKADIP